jgi:hypothetical protein
VEKKTLTSFPIPKIGRKNCNPAPAAGAGILKSGKSNPKNSSMCIESWQFCKMPLTISNFQLLVSKQK